MVSSLSDTENLGLAVKYGTVGFISKPFTRATVYEKLVSIFGKERLERIAKGDVIELKPDLTHDVYNDIISPDLTYESISFDSDTELAPKKSTFDQEKILKHYQDDEKRSIDSIKKLLLKSKK